MIAIRDLSFRYAGGAENALTDIHLTVEDGDFIGITGNSGAGKTTLTYAINGIIPHHFTGDFYGSVLVDGMDTVENRPEQLALSVGSVLQDVDAQMVASVVEDELLFGLENFGVPRTEIEQRVETALRQTGIADLRRRSISTLSGGQKQKVAVAAILALRPKTIILDEPTGELDPQSSRRIFSLLRELNVRCGTTIVVVEQKIMLLCEFVKKLAVMERGKLAFFGPVREVLGSAAELERMGVHVPRVVSLREALRMRGLYSGPAPVDLEEALQMVEEVLV